MRTRQLPRGWPDAARQLLLFAGAYLLYEAVRGIADAGGAARATWNADRVIGLERSLHVFAEPGIQAWTLHRPWLMDIADWTYLDAHGAVTFGALMFIYVRRRDAFPQVRNTFLIAMLLALVGYALFPTAPPRLMPQWGFIDPIRRFTGIDVDHGLGSLLVNPDAAVPSMHVCFALITAGAMSRLCARRAARVAWRLYPVLIAFVVIATGNHYLLDVVTGSLVAALSARLAHRRLARARADVRAFGQATA